IGRVSGIVEGAFLTGTAHGGTNASGMPTGIPLGKKYNILAGGVVAYAEVDFVTFRPFAGLVWGSGDGDPTDNKLHGFSPFPQFEITLITGTPLFAHLDTSTAFQRRDYECPALEQGVRFPSNTVVAQNANNGAGPVTNPYAVGGAVVGGGANPGFECWHTTGNPFNDRIGSQSSLGLRTTYANAGTIDVPVGVRFFP